MLAKTKWRHACVTDCDSMQDASTGELVNPSIAFKGIYSTLCRSPGGPGIRLDGAMATGNIVGSFYDSLLVKVSLHGLWIWAASLWRRDWSLPALFAMLSCPYSDKPLLLQVICRGNTYLHAIQKMQRALYEFHIRGVKTNILFLENVLRHPEFLSGQATTSFIDRYLHTYVWSHT